jgi:hypothetical protein
MILNSDTLCLTFLFCNGGYLTKIYTAIERDGFKEYTLLPGSLPIYKMSNNPKIKF